METKQCKWLSLLLVTVAAACAPLPGARDVPPLSGAIQVNEADQDAWAAAIRGQDLDAVQVTVYARQLRWDSGELLYPDSVPTVLAEIRAAKRAGLRVTLVLRVALEQGLEENRHFWHGMIWPRDDAAVDAWFTAYRNFALWGADLAQTEAVDLLAVASELNSLTSTVVVDELPGLFRYFLDPERTAQVRQTLVSCAARVPTADLASELAFLDGGTYASLDDYLMSEETHIRQWTRAMAGPAAADAADVASLNERRRAYERRWRALLAEVRAVYDGPISYAANFDQVEDVGFWDAFDAIGVNAYYPLSRYGLDDVALRSALSHSWAEIAARLNRIANVNGGPGRVLPVVFFELGWTRKAGSTVRPFSYERVEVLETVAASGDETLTCVHWATQREASDERVQALRALRRVVEEGSFPTLRGFTLWKLSTEPSHRSSEPFVALLPPAGDAADQEYLAEAALLAQRLRLAANPER